MSDAGTSAESVPRASETVAGIVATLRARDETLATAESLTGGALASAFVEVPGVSAVYRGGVVPYATALKHELLGVDPDLLAREGAVHPEVARQMADGVRARLAATWGVATTGVAGPEPQDGSAPGTVHVAASGPSGTLVRTLALPGERPAVRTAAVAAALDLLAEALRVQPWA